METLYNYIVIKVGEMYLILKKKHVSTICSLHPVHRVALVYVRHYL